MFGLFKKKEKTIEFYDVQKLLFAAGWDKYSDSESEFRGYYGFVKENNSIHYHLGHKKYALCIGNSVRKVYSEMMKESEVLDALSLV